MDGLGNREPSLAVVLIGAVLAALVLVGVGPGTAGGSVDGNVASRSGGSSEEVDRKAKPKALPQGAYRARGGLARVAQGKTRVTCARPSKDGWTSRGQWRAVRLVRAGKPPWVIDYLSIAVNLEKRAKADRPRQSGKAKAMIKRRINRLLKKGRLLDKVCRRNSHKFNPNRLRANLKRARALGFVETAGRRNLYSIRGKAGARSTAELEAVVALKISGTTVRGRDVDGPASVQQVVEGPGSLLFVSFPDRHSVDGDVELMTPCSVAVVDTESNAIDCILRGFDRAASLQTDGSGRLYFSVRRAGVLEIHRYDPDSKQSEVILSLPGGVYGSGWHVLGGGGLILRGATIANNQVGHWIRWVSSDGEQEETLSTSYDIAVSSAREFSDGNLYLLGSSAIRRVVVGEAASDGSMKPSLDPRPWIQFDPDPSSPPPSGSEPSAPPYFSRLDLCPDPVSVLGLPAGTEWPLCDRLSQFYPTLLGGYRAEDIEELTPEDDGRVFSLNVSFSGSEYGAELLKLYGPESDPRRAEAIWTRDELAEVGGFAAVGGSLVLYGPSRDDDFLNHIVIQDPLETEQEVVSGGLGALDISSIGSLGNGQAAFTAWQNSTNRYVLGTIDVSTGTARITEDLARPLNTIIPLD